MEKTDGKMGRVGEAQSGRIAQFPTPNYYQIFSEFN
jgi:hypothetical protein